tara:strand:- start:528 stop:767 length:240 start_codon:yes stop_codon:yes gene_type:complete
MSANDIAEECGYESAVDMVMDSMTVEEIRDMLREYLYECDSLIDMVREIASDKHEWHDRDAAQQSHDEDRYQAYKDGDD